MDNLIRTLVFSGSGELLSDRPAGQPDVSDLENQTQSENTALQWHLTSGTPSTSVGEVGQIAESLGLVSRANQRKGYWVILPDGRAIERVIDMVNDSYAAELNCQEISFPSVFELDQDATIDLIEPYSRQQRLVRLAGSDRGAALAYAADPTMLLWLQNQRLPDDELPKGIYSPTLVHRRFRSGEVNLERQRQFKVADMHVLASHDSWDLPFLNCVSAAANRTRLWFDQDWIHVVDVESGSPVDDFDLFHKVACSTGNTTVVRLYSAKTKYYSLKSGFMVYSGYGNVMLHNIQVDLVNGPRFNIKTESGNPVAIVHACGALAINRLVPCIIGRGLSGISPKTFPIDLAPTQLNLVPVENKHLDFTHKLLSTFRATGLRATISRTEDGTVAARVRRLSQSWHSALAIVGDKEVTGTPIQIKEVGSGKVSSASNYLEGRRQFMLRLASPAISG